MYIKNNVDKISLNSHIEPWYIGFINLFGD